MERCIEARYVVGFDEGSKVEKDSSQFYVSVREERMMKYKAVKLITFQEVYEAGDKTCKEFRDEFDNFVHWCFFRWGVISSFFSAIDFNFLEPQLENHPEWANFLLAHGLIEKVEDEVFYSVGDRFRHKIGSEFLLALVDSSPNDGSLVRLIKEDGKGFYGTSLIGVRNRLEITEEEFGRITNQEGLGFFTKIEEGKR